MKRLAPTPFVDVGDEVVESVDEGRDVLGDFDFFGAAKEGPVLFVIVLDFVGGDGAAGEMDDDGSGSCSGGGRKEISRYV